MFSLCHPVFTKSETEHVRLLVCLSCHVIVHSHLSLSMGLRGVLGCVAGVNPSLVSGWGQGTPWTSRQLIAGPSLMSNVGFSISLKDTSTCSSALPRAGIWTSDLPIASRPALPGLSVYIQYYSFKEVKVLWQRFIQQSSVKWNKIMGHVIFIWQNFSE